MKDGTVEIDGAFVARLTELRDEPRTADFTIYTSSYFTFTRSSSIAFSRQTLGLVHPVSNACRVYADNVHLAEDLCRPVRCMIEYFYHFNYIFVRSDFRGPHISDDQVALCGLPPSTGQDQGMPSEAQAHAYMYTLGEKYDIVGLKRLAKAKFEASAICMLNYGIGKRSELDIMYVEDDGDSELGESGQLRPYEKAFLDLIPYVYENTAPNEMGLRDSIVKAWGAASEGTKIFMPRQKWAELLEKYPELGVDMVMGLGGKTTDRHEDSEVGSLSGSFIEGDEYM
ncbi:hypothetical protein M409DRAFT_21009 [Zasmidium cellare ATCC 36951]|uniref:BTB domain-containing protein n=1 Tax=Zasmidium cellare ATCC 36951 TaxID=1080233 RepID=A0A6A6CS40_ZASCE|nr:uncharacterized protein M409DRAFT_21009 [Zasmidium cellare ATCC 36951]KAF2168998.1 hypothetical protein M409DRAFT_21009 [Zasmidium cellare ATCC 36951]